jgi:hypothetical protein
MYVSEPPGKGRVTSVGGIMPGGCPVPPTGFTATLLTRDNESEEVPA